MGIKGIYKEIGPGQRISLTALATTHLETTGRPLRLAIDISIWQFQILAARGGSNPAVRTLFYRLVRLLGHAIQPLFVFDGPNKPAFKRNKRSYSYGNSHGVADAMAKRMIRLFGFQCHDAPGEAEAECALLQREGVVDAVLSEDVDTIMFGCRRTLRNWSAEGTRNSKTPTHVSVYDVHEREGRGGINGLDREGMVLVALMSGGDYLPEGVPGCGVKVACEAARAGFGKELCGIRRADQAALERWKERLTRELRTNESGYFRTRHKALEIPEGFPSLEVLRYYTHPVVSKPETVQRLRRQFPGKQEVDVEGLRVFVRETFDWEYRTGAVKFIRVLAPSLLVQFLLQRSEDENETDDLNRKEKEEAVLVKGIKSRRAHFSTDATPELRISYVPIEIVPVDLDAEPEEENEGFGRDGLALNSDDEFDAQDEPPSSTQGASSAKPFDPLRPDLAWIPETVAKLGVPLTVEIWEEKQRAKELKAANKGTGKARTTKQTGGMPAGALDKYVKVAKAPAIAATATKSTNDYLSLELSPPRSTYVPLASQQLSQLSSDRFETVTTTSRTTTTTSKGTTKASSSRTTSKKTAATSRPPAGNPWSLAGSQASTRITKNIASSQPAAKSSLFNQEPILISSSPSVTGKRLPNSPLENNRSFSPDPFASSPPPPSVRWKERLPATRTTSDPTRYPSQRSIRDLEEPSRLRSHSSALASSQRKGPASGKDKTPTKQKSMLDFGYPSTREQSGSRLFGRTQSAVLPSTTGKTLEPLSDDDDEFERTMLASLKSSRSKAFDHKPSLGAGLSSSLFSGKQQTNSHLDETDEDDELERAIQASIKDIRPTSSAPVASSRTKAPLFQRGKVDLGALDEEDDSDNDDSFASIGALTRQKSPSPIRPRASATLSPSLSARRELAREKRSSPALRSSPVPSPRTFQRAESARSNLLSSKWDWSAVEDDAGHGTRATSVGRTVREASIGSSRATPKRSLLFPGLNLESAEDRVTSEEMRRQTAREGSSSSRRWRLSEASFIDLTGDD
ncbi:hypothetical protein QBC32DRAFT_378746 [Pseudoneurospora amorphoporcata]|uniref:Flap structure-specific endonuclease n=1 Tax=Pseudoneurospora amorphoporcata TaxID=241081 RepID=A0AAN6NP34_9PEZI|nr:hypothetical protein QBC32DRAFT_378746 [Pseudoneurospora amorphoporcata]